MKRIVSIFFSILLGISLYGAEVVVDKKASPELQMDKAANGVPLVNIVAPNASGLSHNVFQEYHVGKEGIVYNNGVYFSESTLGGLIYGNPNLQAEQKTAQTILAEVSGTGRSKLEGFTEIAGDKANYILANPNGIYVNGAGFINTPQVTLTTGNPKTGIVTQGSLEIDGKGLDLRNVNRAALIARVATLTGAVYGGENLRVELGSKTTSQKKPELALDARELGSLYAGRIAIISNEDGVGVKSNSQLSSTQGDVDIQSKGNVSLRETESKGNLSILAKNVEVTERMAAEGKISISSNLNNHGRIEANQDIRIQGNLKNQKDLFSYQSLLVHGFELDNTGTLFSKKDMKLTSKRFHNQGKLFTPMSISIQSSSWNNDGSMRAEENMEIVSEQFQNTKNLLAKELRIHSNTIDNQGSIAAESSFSMTGKKFHNTGSLFAQKEARIIQEESRNSGDILSEGRLEISGKTMENQGKIHAQENLSLHQNSIRNQGSFLSEKNVVLQSNELDNQGNIVSKGNLSIQTKGLQGRGNIFSGEKARIQADAISLHDKIAAKEFLLLDTKALHLQDSYRTAGDLSIRIQGDYQNKQALMARKLDLQAQTIENRSILTSKKKLFLRAKNIQNQKNSLIYSGGALEMEGENLENRGEIFSKEDLTLRFQRDIHNLTANIESEGNALLQAKNFVNQGHLTGSYTKRWVPGFASSVDVSKLPASFLEEVDREMENGLSNTGRRRSYWHGNDRHLSKAEQGTTQYVSHKSYLQAKQNLRLEIQESLRNQEADILAGANIDIRAKELINAREGKGIPITLEFARTYSYSKKKTFSWTTKFDEIYVHIPYTQTLYSDKATRIVAGGNLNIHAKTLGNGESFGNHSSSFSGKIAQPGNYLHHNVKAADTSFDILNHDVVKKIKKEGAISVLEYVELPKGEGGLFQIASPKNPKFSYLIEANPWFVDKDMYLGSEYFFSRIAFNPDKNIRLLGDSYYETKLINKAVLEGTGKRYLYSQDGNKERKMLFDAGIQAQKDLKLSLGVALTAEQRQRLQADMLWYVEENVHGETVLVPRLYLSKRSVAALQKQEGTALLAGGDLSIQALEVSNEGKIQGEGKVLFVSDRFHQDALYADTRVAGKQVQILAKESLKNMGGEFLGKEGVLLHSDGNIVNEKKMNVRANDFHNMYSEVRGSGNIEGKNVSITGQKFENKGASITAQEGVFLSAKQGIRLDTVESVSGDASGNPKDFVKRVSKRNLGSEVKGDTIQLVSGEDIVVRGSTLAANKEVELLAKKDIEIVAVQDSDLYERHKESSKSFGRGSSETEIQYNMTHKASQVTGEQLQLQAGKTIDILGSHVQAGTQGMVNLEAGENIRQAGVKDTTYSFQETTKKGMLGLTKKTKSQESYQEEAIRSAMMAGDKGISYDAKHDIVLEGVNVVSTGSIQTEGKNLSIQPLETNSWTKTKEKNRGFAGSIGRGSVSISYGTDKKEQTQKNTIQHSSQITAGKKLELSAQEKLRGSSVELYGKEEVNILGKQGVELTSAKHVMEQENKQSSKRLGASIGIKHEIVNTIDNVRNIRKLSDFSGNSYDVANTASKLVGAIKDGAAATNTVISNDYKDKADSVKSENLKGISTDWKDYVSANVGLSSSKSESSRYTETVAKNKIGSEGNVTIASQEDNVSLEGTDIQAGKDVLLVAKDKVEVKAGEEENRSFSSSSQRGLSAGISASGVTLTASASGQKGKGEGTNYVNSHIQAGGDYEVLAKEILHEGANVEANTIHMVGEKITIASKQDVSKQKDSSYGGSLSVNITSPALSSASLSGSRGKGEGAWVNKQSSLVAKEGGSIVAEHFENKGAILASQSEKNKLQIQADTIHVEDMEDKNKYENKGGGISLSASVPNLSVKHDTIDKEQVTRATAINTDFVIAGETKEADSLGFNTELDKAQEVTKEEEKHLDAELHTDLLEKKERDKIVMAGKKLEVAKEAILSEGKGGKYNTFKEGLQGIYVNAFKEEHEKEFNLVKDKSVSPEKRLAVIRKLQADFYKQHGYQGALPEILLTDSPNSYTQDGKNKTTGEKQTEKIFLSLDNLNDETIGAAFLLAHETAHLNTYEEGKKGEESSFYTRSKVSKEDSKQQFSEEEKKAYLGSLEEYKAKKTLEEQFAEAKKVPEEEKEDFAIGFSKNISGSFIGRVNAGTSKYLVFNEETKDIEYAKTIDFGIGLGIPNLGGSGSIILLKDVNTVQELEGHTFVLGGSVPFVGGEIILNDKREFAGIRIVKGGTLLQVNKYDVYGSIDNTILIRHKNIAEEIKILQSDVQENLVKLEKLTNKKENISKNIVKISKISSEIENSLERMELLWKYNP